IVVLGGLVQDSVTGTQEKVPVLGDIPLIGGLFRYESRRNQKTNLMVFLRPFIVRDEDAARNLAIDRYDAMRTLQQQQQLPPSSVLPEMPSPVAPPAPPGETQKQ
ncbi:MAG: type II secretion system protein GspD, partial [Betaproteobacteria bacterium]